MSFVLKAPRALYIGSQWLAPASGDTEGVISPASEQVIGIAPVGGRADVEAALASARDAFDRGPWPRMARNERAAKLHAFHHALARCREEMGGICPADVISEPWPAGRIHGHGNVERATACKAT